MSEITYLCAGINHQAWYLDYRVERRGCLPAASARRIEQARDLQRGAGAQRDVPAPRLLRHRVQRPQLRVQRLVPQAPGPDREVLHPRHRLEPRRATPTSSTSTCKREDTWRDEIEEWLDEAAVDLERGHEYAASIFNATIGDGDAVRVQRQRAQLRPDRQPARGLLRRGAGAGLAAAGWSRSTSGRCRRSSRRSRRSAPGARSWRSRPRWRATGARSSTRSASTR